MLRRQVSGPASRRRGRPYAFTAFFRFAAAVRVAPRPFARGLLRKELMKLSHQVRIV